MLIIFDLDGTLYDRAGQVPDNYTEQDLQQLKPFPGVKEFLQSFSGTKILVTKETDPGLQDKKINALGIRPYFHSIYICHTDEEKKKSFQEIQQQFPGEELVVVGDRIDLEVKFGKELGLKTVWMRQGKHRDRRPQEYWEVPDYEISEFSELAEVLPSPP